MLDALIKGYGLGLMLSLLAGPAFFVLVYTSLRLGWRAALLFALGVWLSDLLYIVIAYVGVSALLESLLANRWVGIVGGLVLAIVGVLLILRVRRGFQPVPIRRRIRLRTRTQLLLFVQGFALNFTNPFVFIYWLGIATIGKTLGQGELLVFMLSVLAGLISLDLVKIYAARVLSRFLTPRLMRLINVILGIILTLSGLVLTIRSFQLHD